MGPAWPLCRSGACPGRVQSERQGHRGQPVAGRARAERIAHCSANQLAVSVEFALAASDRLARRVQLVSTGCPICRAERHVCRKLGASECTSDERGSNDATSGPASDRVGDPEPDSPGAANSYALGHAHTDSVGQRANPPFAPTTDAASVDPRPDAFTRIAVSESTGAIAAQRTHLLVPDDGSKGVDARDDRIALVTRLAAAVPVVLLGNAVPNIGMVFVVTLGVFCLGYGALVAIIRAQSWTDQDREWAERFTLTADLSLVAFALLVFAPDPGWAIYASGFFVIASGAFRFRNGALLAAASLSLAYIVVAIFRTSGLAIPFSPVQLALHLGSYLVAGVLMNAVLPQLDALRRREADVYEPILRAQEETGEALVMTEDGRPVYWNRAFEDLTGLSTDHLGRSSSLAGILGIDGDALVAVRDAVEPWRTWIRGREGRSLAVEISCQLVDGSDAQRMVWMFRDVTVREQSEAELRERALHDGLTGLPNRTLLADRLASAIGIAQRQFAPVSVLLLDLDGFKQVNDLLGHESGDNVLIEVAKRITGALRDSDTAARLGGDEFVVVLPATGMSGAVATARALNQVIADPIPLALGARAVSASIGIAVFPDDGRDPTTLLAAADARMYEAKRTGCGWCSQAQAAGQ